MIRVGMTKDEVDAIMPRQSGLRHDRIVLPAAHPSKPSEMWFWRPLSSMWSSNRLFVVKFDDTGRVATTVAGHWEQ